MGEEITEQEARDVDKMMADHMWGHQISNSYANFRCDPQCRVEALRYAINTMLVGRTNGE